MRSARALFMLLGMLRLFPPHGKQTTAGDMPEGIATASTSAWAEGLSSLAPSASRADSQSPNLPPAANEGKPPLPESGTVLWESPEDIPTSTDAWNEPRAPATTEAGERESRSAVPGGGSAPPREGFPLEQFAVGPGWKEAVYKRLAYLTVSFDFEEAPLGAVLYFFQDKVKANLVVAPTVDLDAPVTMKVKDMTLGRALNWVLRLNNLHLSIEDEALYIYTEPTEKKMSLKLYPVGDLILPSQEYRPSPGEALGEETGTQTGEGARLSP
ncbi:MAG: hypothetical protein V1918_02360 [Planctomycetota bacterium]